MTNTMTPPQFSQWLNHAQAIEVDGLNAIAWPDDSGIHFSLDNDGDESTLDIEFTENLTIALADDGLSVMVNEYVITCYTLQTLSPMDYVK